MTGNIFRPAFGLTADLCSWHADLKPDSKHTVQHRVLRKVSLPTYFAPMAWASLGMSCPQVTSFNV
jgi:hypothetical protein